jgi:hypothetical protein
MKHRRVEIKVVETMFRCALRNLSADSLQHAGKRVFPAAAEPGR